MNAVKEVYKKTRGSSKIRAKRHGNSQKCTLCLYKKSIPQNHKDFPTVISSSVLRKFLKARLKATTEGFKQLFPSH